MVDTETLLNLLGLVVVAAPACLLASFFGFFLLDRQPSEATVARLMKSAIAVSLLAALTAAAVMVAAGLPHHTIVLGDWIVTRTFHLRFQFVLDVLSISYAILALVLCTTIGAFSTRYLHRERGYNRFFVLFAVFLLGMVVAALSDTVETLFAGWEMVGLSSVLLIAFFQERPAPPRNGLRVWVIYRVCDAALMLAAVLMHELNGRGDFDLLVGAGAWPHAEVIPPAAHLMLLGLLFVAAAAGKSALIPFAGWLPRAMEGPTPSSAVFYGALSVHLGAFLLLRISPLLASSVWLSGLVVALGLTTAVFAYVVGRAQTDIKSALAFASLTQVGVIFAEIGLGFDYLALIHLLGHACLRTLQFVRAPSLLHDHHQLENAIGSRPKDEQPSWEQKLSPGAQRRLYRFALERGHLDSLLETLAVRPFMGLFGRLDAFDRRLASLLGDSSAARPPREVK